jgi:hypothetical protein
VTLAAILRGWGSDVRRFIGGVHSTPIKDAIVWGADDYVGALTMRSMVEDARSQVPAGLKVQFDAWLEQIDSDYRGFTAPDDAHLLGRWIHQDVPDQWWWHRVPPSGPVLDDLMSIG